MKRIKCKQCGQKVDNDFLAKFYHVLQVHPDKAVNAVFDANISGKAFALGRKLAESIQQKGVAS